MFPDSLHLRFLKWVVPVLTGLGGENQEGEAKVVTRKGVVEVWQDGIRTKFFCFFLQNLCNKI